MHTDVFLKGADIGEVEIRERNGGCACDHVDNLVGLIAARAGCWCRCDLREVHCKCEYMMDLKQRTFIDFDVEAKHSSPEGHIDGDVGLVGVQRHVDVRDGC